MRLTILHHDHDLVAIDKPIAMPTHAAQEDPYPGDVVGVLKRQLGCDYLGIHQRLDADTSGVLLFTLRESANGPLAHAFESRRVHKHYVALVHGVPGDPEGTIDLPLAPAPGGRRAVAHANDPLARRALTRYAVRTVSPDRRFTLVDLFPETGRTHQLRVHMAALGAPIVGDPLYDSEYHASRFFPRLMLHAHGLELPHPATGGQFRIGAPIPYGFIECAEGGDATARSTETLVRLALARRQPIEQGASTNAWRVIDGEGDGLPGCTVDRYGSAMIHRTRGADEEHKQLRELIPGAYIDASEAGEALNGREVMIEALRFPVELIGRTIAPRVESQENIARVRHWARGARVLACGVATHGLALAALASADDLFVVERSRDVIDWLKRSAALNALDERPMGVVAGELHEQLERLARKGRTFDVVIVDTRALLARATRADRTLECAASLAQSLVSPGGMLLLLSDDPSIPRRTYRRRILSAIAAEAIAHYDASRIDAPASALQMLVVRALSGTGRND